MPKFVQQVTGKGYSFVGPQLEWVRGKNSLFDGACGKIETIVTPVISTTDKCIDATCNVVSLRVSAVKTSVANTVAPVQAKLGEVQGAIVVRSLDLVDSSESLIDRLLPLPSRALKDAAEQEKTKQRNELVYRVARLPFAVPMRVTMIMYVKANGAIDTVLLSGRQVAGFAREKQNQFAEQVMQRAKPLTDKVSATTSSAMQKARAGKSRAAETLYAGQNIITVRVNNLVVRLHLVEAKDWSVDAASNLKSGTQRIVMTVVRTAQGTTTRIIGQQRAATLFAKLHIPVELDQSVAVPQKPNPITVPVKEVQKKMPLKDEPKKVAEPKQFVEPKVESSHHVQEQQVVASSDLQISPQ